MSDIERAQWQEELDNYGRIQKLFILEGNTNDLQLCNIFGSRYELVNLEAYLYNTLKKSGYRSIVFYNRIDGFYKLNDDIKEEELDFFLQDAGIKKSDVEKVDMLTAAKGIREALKNANNSKAVILLMSGQMIGSADNLNEKELEVLMTLMLAAKDSRSGRADNVDGWVNNLLILIVNKVQELPTWFYRYSPLFKVLTLDKPNDRFREYIISGFTDRLTDWGSFNQAQQTEAITRLTGQTDGFTCVEIKTVFDLYNNLTCEDMEEKLITYRHGRSDNPWKKIPDDIINNIENYLSKRVIGQSKAINAVSDVIMRAYTDISTGKNKRNHRPRGILLFAGPTGTGKTELAKTMAKTIFGTESAMIRFDMSEYGQPHSDQRLLGAPPGYVGYDAGGELTNAVRAHPFSILLFDEIDKAHESILDKFLQILDDGRMTDSKGETVYFSETIIVFTTNIGITRKNRNGVRENLVKPSDSIGHIEDVVTKEIRNEWRPEFVNRLGNNIVVFDFIRDDTAEKIMNMQLKQLFDSILEERGITVKFEVDSSFYKKLREKSLSSLEYGGRGIRNIIESNVTTPIGRKLLRENIKRGSIMELTDLIYDDERIEIKANWK